MSKRNLFLELTQGIEEIKQHGKGKITLREYKIEGQFIPSVAVFAHQLCVPAYA
ncbi:MAG: hypothetical protein ACYC69_12635 [Thermodesulfovibrionales bacterium]